MKSASLRNSVVFLRGVRWRASLWAKNVFNHVYETQALYTSVGWTYQYGAPRTYGINLSYKM